jgi:hypothetical protein
MITPERIVAYVDGELDGAARAEVEAAASADPVVAADIAAHRSLRAQLAAAFGPIAGEPVPDRLLTATVSAEAVAEAPTETEVIAFKPRAGLNRPLVMQLAAMAACLVAGVLLTFAVTTPRGDFTATSSGLIARGALKQALTRQLAADDAVAGRPRIGLTFRDDEGNLCRTFTTTANEGLACRQASDWRIDVASRAASSPEFTQAGSPLLIQAVEARIAGEPFDAAAEKQARDKGWQ